MREPLPTKQWRFFNGYNGEVLECKAKTLKGAKGIIRRYLSHLHPNERAQFVDEELYNKTKVCPECHGRCWLVEPDYKCNHCAGQGRVPDPDYIDTSVQKGFHVVCGNCGGGDVRYDRDEERDLIVCNTCPNTADISHISTLSR